MSIAPTHAAVFTEKNIKSLTLMLGRPLTFVPLKLSADIAAL